MLMEMRNTATKYYKINLKPLKSYREQIVEGYFFGMPWMLSLVSSGMGNSFSTGELCRSVASHPSQLILAWIGATSNGDSYRHR